MTNLNGQQPRYRQLAQALLNDIQDGKYKIGSLLPTEHELCTQFGASRFTVRQALKQMIQLGLVTRQPGVGTRLISVEASSIYRQGLESVSDIHQYAADTELHVLDTAQLTIEPGELCDMLKAAPGQEWLHINSIRRTTNNAEKPICFTEIFLPPPFRTLRGLKGKTKDAVYRLIEAQFGEKTVEVRQQISAGTLPPTLEKQLSAKPQSPCLWITRTYLNGRGNVVEVSRSAHPGDRFHYEQVFRQQH
ncbi:GntR family transcriptional regulator [Nitratireductor soli]|uniref:GntR family transcriptional regulator n=1 Tax=Nitratireductor soli TaxID=1670619 RepID=UPI00065E61AD|nr:GntR family transcriptional regulator [Nitratireductor soli]